MPCVKDRSLRSAVAAESGSSNAAFSAVINVGKLGKETAPGLWSTWGVNQRFAEPLRNEAVYANFAVSC